MTAYRRTVRRFGPIGLAVMAGSAIGRGIFRHADLGDLSLIAMAQVVALLAFALLLTPIEYHKLKRAQP